MFAERFDALMNIAEVTNSLLGRNINMDPSHIGRLRSGARPLPRKHDFLPNICLYLAAHIKKDYQFTSLQKITGIGSDAVASCESMAMYLERWLLEQEPDTGTATGRLISGFSRITARPQPSFVSGVDEGVPQKYATYLYGNAGKRKAVEQFFLMILQEKEPQTLLLFSDENFAWLYGDSSFAARWAELFMKVLAKGNQVHMIHTVSRDMNDMVEGITKWIPIYMTGAVKPYCYPRLRDELFQRTMFIAPNTAAVISSSVRQNTDGMLNLFLTDKIAVHALKTEYERYLALCRPLMRIYTEQDAVGFCKAYESLMSAAANSCQLSDVPPLFSMPESLVMELSKETGDETMLSLWKNSLAVFRRNIKTYRLSLILLDPALIAHAPENIHFTVVGRNGIRTIPYTKAQYDLHIDKLRQMEKQYGNLQVLFRSDVSNNTLLCVKEDAGVILAKTDSPMSAFEMSDRSMVLAFWEYLMIQ